VADRLTIYEATTLRKPIFCLDGGEHFDIPCCNPCNEPEYIPSKIRSVLRFNGEPSVDDNHKEINPMTVRASIRMTFFLVAGIAIAFAVTVGARHIHDQSPAAQPHLRKTTITALNVQAQAAQGFAAPGNMQPANFLVLVTDAITGAAVTDLAQSNFSVINHFSVPGATCGFSNNITSFNNVGTGAYQIQVAPRLCVWVQGDYLAQVIVSVDPLRGGQAPAILSIK